MAFVVASMLSSVAAWVSRPTAAEPVTARRSPGGGRCVSVLTHSRIRSTARCVFRERYPLSSETIDNTA